MKWLHELTVVECHVGGEVAVVVTAGAPALPGATMAAKRDALAAEHDWVRQLLLREPRGGVTRSADIIYPSQHPDADFGFVILESTEYPLMSGGNTMCVATVLLETGMVTMHEPVTELVLESPAGLIYVTCTCRDGKVVSARIVNQPAFVHRLDVEVDVPGLGQIDVDVAWGGMGYAIVDTSALGLTLEPSAAASLSELGQRIKAAAAEQVGFEHPAIPEAPGITQTLFAGPISRSDGMVYAQNAVVISPGRLDRCPCGTGTSARLALMHRRGLIEVGETFVHTSIIDATFEARIEEVVDVQGRPAVIPSIAGQAWITGFSVLSGTGAPAPVPARSGPHPRSGWGRFFAK
jgi:proline racemase